MKTSLDEKGFTLREATERDIPKLSIHHRKMFEEIWGKKGLYIDNSTGSEIEQEYWGDRFTNASDLPRIRR